MQILAISGSTRQASTNTSLLRKLAEVVGPGTTVSVFGGLGDLPIFTPDQEADPPAAVLSFIAQIEAADGLIISSPEYLHAIPGGLKNAIDWLVSGDAIIDKPIAIMHASHRGEDLLASLRLVLSTVSTRFSKKVFLRLPLMSKTPQEVSVFLDQPENQKALKLFLDQFLKFAAT